MEEMLSFFYFYWDETTLRRSAAKYAIFIYQMQFSLAKPLPNMPLNERVHLYNLSSSDIIINKVDIKLSLFVDDHKMKLPWKQFTMGSCQSHFF